MRPGELSEAVFIPEVRKHTQFPAIWTSGFSTDLQQGLADRAQKPGPACHVLRTVLTFLNDWGWESKDCLRAYENRMKLTLPYS